VKFSLAFCSLLLAASSATVDAQPDTTTSGDSIFRQGARVRVVARSVAPRRFEGSVQAVFRDTVVIDTAPSSTVRGLFSVSTVPVDSRRRVIVPVSAIQSAEVSIGRSRAVGMRQWALRLGLIGAVVVGVGSSPELNPSLSDMGRGAGIGLASGVALGALIGYLNPVEKWRRLPVPQRVGSSPPGRGF
jgi:hypothetical protein